MATRIVDLGHSKNAGASYALNSPVGNKKTINEAELIRGFFKYIQGECAKSSIAIVTTHELAKLDSNSFLSPARRVVLARKYISENKGVLGFYSLHCDSSTSSKPSGATVLYNGSIGGQEGYASAFWEAANAMAQSLSLNISGNRSDHTSDRRDLAVLKIDIEARLEKLIGKAEAAAAMKEIESIMKMRLFLTEEQDTLSIIRAVAEPAFAKKGVPAIKRAKFFEGIAPQIAQFERGALLNAAAPEAKAGAVAQHVPALLFEAGFGSNPTELMQMFNHADIYGKIIVAGMNAVEKSRA